MAMNKPQLEKSRDLHVRREREYKAKAKREHELHRLREKQLAELAQAATKPKVAMPVLTDMAKNTNDWGPGHDGIDLLCAANAPLLAMCKSKVVRVNADHWWGNNPQPSPGHPVADGDGIIILECLISAGPLRPGLHLCYGHAEHATVKVGQVVEAGQVIGKAGFARAWHVHFMVNDDPPVNGLYRGVGDRDPAPILQFAKENS